MVGLIGLEPMTLRLSSACSNQLSYRPKVSIKSLSLKFKVKTDGRQLFQADSELQNLKLNSENLKLFCGGRGIRTPDIQLAKLALYQLSYTPFNWTLLLACAMNRACLGLSGWRM